MKRLVCVVVVLLAGSMQGQLAEYIEFSKNRETDGLKFLNIQKNFGSIDSFTVTSTNLIIRAGAGGIFASNAGPHVEIILTPDKETVFVIDHGRMVFKPISLKGQQKGFRVSEMAIGAGAHKHIPVVVYVALSDTPMIIGENDVKMIMDNGKWVNAKDSKSLIVEKLGWHAEWLVQDAEKDMQDAERMASILQDPYLANIWHTLVENGLIKTNSEPQLEGGRATTSPPNTLWLYVIIPLCLLCTFLYFLRRKLKTGNLGGR